MGDYLARLGLRKIGLVTYPPQFSVGVKERIFGFQSALVSHSMPAVPDELIFKAPSEILESSFQLHKYARLDSIVKFIESHPDIEAIAAIDALLCRLVCDACNQLGRIDITVVCCDEPAFYSSHLPHAYVDQSPFEMGEMAARMITDSIEHGTLQHFMITPKLVINSQVASDWQRIFPCHQITRIVFCEFVEQIDIIP